MVEASGVGAVGKVLMHFSVDSEGNFAPPAFEYVTTGGRSFTYTDTVKAALGIQRAYRGWTYRMAYVDVRLAICELQRCYRGMADRKRLKQQANGGTGSNIVRT